MQQYALIRAVLVCLVSGAGCTAGADQEFVFAVDGKTYDGSASLVVHEPQPLTFVAQEQQPLTELQVSTSMGADDLVLVAQTPVVLDALDHELVLPLQDQRVADPDDPIVRAFAAKNMGGAEFQTVSGSLSFRIVEGGTISGGFDAVLTPIDNVPDPPIKHSGSFHGPFVLMCMRAIGEDEWVVDRDFETDFCAELEPYSH